MNRFLGLLLTLMFSLTFIFANIDSFEKSITPEDFNFYDSGNIEFTIKTLETVNLDLIIAIDNSKGIMHPEKLNSEKELAIELINLLDANDKVALIGFDNSNDAITYNNLTSNFINVKLQIQDLVLIAPQNINLLLEEANSELNNDSKNTKLVVLISDGAPTYNSEFGNLVHNSILTYLEKNDSYAIYTISVDNIIDANREIMQTIADLTGGKYSDYNSQENNLSEIINDFNTEFNAIKTYDPNVIIKDIIAEGIEYLGNDDCEYNSENREVTCIIESMDLNSELKIELPIKLLDPYLEKTNDSLTLYYDDYLYDYELFLDYNWQPTINLKYTLKLSDDNALGYKNQALEIDVLANDLYFNPITFTNDIDKCKFAGKKPLPTVGGGITQNFENNTIIYTPPKDFLGDGYFWYGITDGISIDCAFVYVQITSTPPILNKIGNKTITQNSKLEFVITATDEDSNKLIFAIENLPSSASFIDNNNNTATFSWTPSTIGKYNITFSVSDENSTIKEDISITVKQKSIGGSGGSPKKTTTVCVPEIKYSNWSECIDEKQTRTYEIVNFCENMFIGATERSCIMPKKDANIIIEDSNLIDQNISVNNDENTNLKSPVGLFTLGNGLFWGLIVLALLIIAYIVYRIIIARKNKPIVKKSKK